MAEAKPLGARDTLLFTLAMNVGLPWIAVAAVAGASSLLLWLLALVAFFVPLAVASIDLTSRFEGEGGIYAWVRGTFGEFAGFMCGWIYWTSNFSFFAVNLYALVTALALASKPEANTDTLSPLLIMSSSIGVALVVLLLQLRGLGVGKWITNAGGVAVLAMLAVIIMGGVFFAGASATDFTKASYVPPVTADTAILWSTMVFAYCGVEGLAFLRAEISDGMRRDRCAAIRQFAGALPVANGGAADRRRFESRPLPRSQFQPRPNHRFQRRDQRLQPAGRGRVIGAGTVNVLRRQSDV